MTIPRFLNQRLSTVIAGLALAVWLVSAPATAAEPPAGGVVDSAQPEVTGAELLDSLALEFWQRLNEARRDPLAAAARLQIPEETVRIVFADTPWIPDSGLPPLAWDAQLVASSAAHNRDMFERLYYSYVSPDGSTFDQRIVAAGFEPRYTGETINALFFENYLPLETALELIVDAMIRDELTGHTAVQRNLFEPELTAVGISFRAEQSRLIRGLPYVYMVVADFAAPVVPQGYLIGYLDADQRLLLRTADTGYWQEQALLAQGLFQVAAPSVPASLAVANPGPLGTLIDAVSVQEQDARHNRFVDFRSPVAADEW